MLSLHFVCEKNKKTTQNKFKNLGIKVFEERFGEGLFSKSPFPRKYKRF